jgi:hypothetical protein
MSAIDINQNEIPTKSSGLSTADDAAADALHNVNIAPEVATRVALDQLCLLITDISLQLRLPRIGNAALNPTVGRGLNKEQDVGVARMGHLATHLGNTA